MSFAETVANLPSGGSIDLGLCRAAIKGLAEEVNDEVLGQPNMVRRIVQAALLNGHVLLEAIPGEGKTTCAKEFARRCGSFMSRIQIMPDMMPSELIGRRVLFLHKSKQELKWVHGPIFAPVVLADEINRASPRLQAALLEAMQERQVSRIDQERSEEEGYRPETVYLPRHRRDLEGLFEQAEPRACFGILIPDPDDSNRVPFTVIATQNPIEMEGTYPLSEAQTDRFMFKVVVDPVEATYHKAILKKNLQPEGRTPSSPTPCDDIPLWLRTACLFEYVRNELLVKQGGMLDSFMSDKPGLLERISMVLTLSHFQGDGNAPAGGFQRRLDALTKSWAASAAAGSSGPLVNPVLCKPHFNFVESGSSARGLIDWCRAACGEAFLEGDDQLERKHFRAVATDVLRHRIRLSPQARADHITVEGFIQELMELLPESANASVEDRRTEQIRYV